jgi:FixJ family two-component response regulator
MITGHGDIAMAVRAVQTGASDFIEKPFNDQALLESIHLALEQDAKNRGQAMQQEEIMNRLAQLTQREREVLEQVVAGKRNKVIAFDLNITQSTVEAHRSRVMEKMQAKSLSDLMRMVLSLRLN